jgi:hypothetical protein
VLDLLGDPENLRLVEEIERGVEVLQVHQPRGPRRGLLGDLLAPLLRCGGVAPGGIRAGLLRHGSPALPEEFHELVLDVQEFLLPQQRQQIVAGVRGEIARPIDRLQEPRQLLLLRAPPDRERAHAVLEQSPGETVTLGELLIDDLVFPNEVGLRHREHQFVRSSPDPLKRGLKILGRPLVHGIVGEIHVKGAKRFHQDLEKLRDLRRGKQVGVGRSAGHTGCRSKSAT